MWRVFALQTAYALQSESGEDKPPKNEHGIQKVYTIVRLFSFPKTHWITISNLHVFVQASAPENAGQLLSCQPLWTWNAVKSGTSMLERSPKSQRFSCTELKSWESPCFFERQAVGHWPAKTPGTAAVLCFFLASKHFFKILDPTDLSTFVWHNLCSLCHFTVPIASYRNVVVGAGLVAHRDWLAVVQNQAFEERGSVCGWVEKVSIK